MFSCGSSKGEREGKHERGVEVKTSRSVDPFSHCYLPSDVQSGLQCPTRGRPVPEGLHRRAAVVLARVEVGMVVVWAGAPNVTVARAAAVKDALVSADAVVFVVAGVVV